MKKGLSSLRNKDAGEEDEQIPVYKMESKDLSLVSNKVLLEGLPRECVSPYILDSCG